MLEPVPNPILTAFAAFSYIGLVSFLDFVLTQLVGQPAIISALMISTAVCFAGLVHFVIKPEHKNDDS
jgi:hypothetical protein